MGIVGHAKMELIADVGEVALTRSDAKEGGGPERDVTYLTPGGFNGLQVHDVSVGAVINTDRGYDDVFHGVALKLEADWSTDERTSYRADITAILSLEEARRLQRFLKFALAESEA